MSRAIHKSKVISPPTSTGLALVFLLLGPVSAFAAPTTLPSPREFIDRLKNREAKMDNLAFTAVQTNTVTPVTADEIHAWHGLLAKYKVKWLGGKVLFEQTAYDRTGNVSNQSVSGWNGDVERSAAHVTTFSTSDDKPDGQLISAVIRDSTLGHRNLGMTSVRMFHLIGIRVEQGYKMVNGQYLEETPMTLSEYLQTDLEPGGAKFEVSSEMVGDRALFVLSFSSPYLTNLHESFWIDPSRDDMPVRYEGRISRGEALPPNQSMYEVTEAKQTNGFWFPARILIHTGMHADAAVRGVEDYVISDVEFGTVSPEMINVDFPVGATVIDYINRTGYKIVDETTAQPVVFAARAGDPPIVSSPDEILNSLAKHPPSKTLRISRVLGLDQSAFGRPSPSQPAKRAYLDWLLGGGLAALGLMLFLYSKRARRVRNERM